MDLVLEGRARVRSHWQNGRYAESPIGTKEESPEGRGRCVMAVSCPRYRLTGIYPWLGDYFGDGRSIFADLHPSGRKLLAKFGLAPTENIAMNAKNPAGPIGRRPAGFLEPVRHSDFMNRKNSAFAALF